MTLWPTFTIPPAICPLTPRKSCHWASRGLLGRFTHCTGSRSALRFQSLAMRSEEHTSELQSRSDLVCRLLLEKKKKNKEEVAERIRLYVHTSQNKVVYVVYRNEKL